MFRNTDLAFRSRLDAWLNVEYGANWANTIHLSYLNPSKLIVAYDSNEKINIAVQRVGGIKEDRMREHESESDYLYLDDTTPDSIVAIPFPVPKIFTYQVDIITWSARGNGAQTDHNAAIERWLNAYGYAFKIGAVWVAGTYDILSSLDCIQAAEPQTLDNQDGDGEFRMTFRYNCYTWLFPSLTPINVGRIKYRVFEQFEIGGDYIRRHEPDA